MKNEKMKSAMSSGAKMGPAGDACHMQIASGPGSDKPMRTKKMRPDGGYHVTSAPAKPSQVMDLKRRP